MTVAQAEELVAKAPTARPADRRQPDATVQPPLRPRGPPDSRAAPRRGAPRHVRELRLGREPAGQPLVLEPHARAAESSSSTASTSSTCSPAGSVPCPGVSSPRLAGIRPGTAIEEHVQCTVRYGDTPWVNFYHGFHQTGQMDRQELRIVFERGDITLYDWVPTRLRLTALVDERQTRELSDLFPGARLDVLEPYGGKDRSCRGRGLEYDVYQKISLAFGDGQAKSPLYCQLLRALMADQLAWIETAATSGS